MPLEASRSTAFRELDWQGLQAAAFDLLAVMLTVIQTCQKAQMSMNLGFQLCNSEDTDVWKVN